MLLSLPQARLITLFKTRLIKFYLNSLIMTDPIYLEMIDKTTKVSFNKFNSAKITHMCVILTLSSIYTDFITFREQL